MGIFPTQPILYPSQFAIFKQNREILGKKRGGWTVCEINVNKLKTALKDGRKFIDKIADILNVYIFTLNIIRMCTIPFSPVFFIFYIFKVQLGDVL